MSNGLCDFIRGNSCAALGRIRVRQGVETRRVGGAADATPGEAEARNAVEEAIWIYNHRRLHEKLNYKTPAAFRAEWKEVA